MKEEVLVTIWDQSEIHCIVMKEEEMVLVTGVIIELQDVMFGKKLRFVLEEKGDHNTYAYFILFYDETVWYSIQQLYAFM